MHPLALAHRFETMRAKLQTLLLDSDDACTSEFCIFFTVAATLRLICGRDFHFQFSSALFVVHFQRSIFHLPPV
jgi:hypothetical protein